MMTLDEKMEWVNKNGYAIVRLNYGDDFRVKWQAFDSIDSSWYGNIVSTKEEAINEAYQYLTESGE